MCLQTKGDGHYRYFCPFACQPRLGQVQHTTGRKALEQHLITDHLDQLRMGSSQLLYVEPQAVILSNCPGLVLGPLIPLRGRLCRFDLSAKASQTDINRRCAPIPPSGLAVSAVMCLQQGRFHKHVYRQDPLLIMPELSSWLRSRRMPWIYQL